MLEVPNRGRGRIVSVIDGGDWDAVQDAGDGWLLRNGYSVVSLGWQWDAAGDGTLRLYAPIAKENGSTIHGLLRGDLMPSKAMDEMPLGHVIVGNIGGSEYSVAAPDDPRNQLAVRDTPEAPRAVILRSDWQFAQTVDGKRMASDRHIHLSGGFQPGKIYEYIYVVSDPVVAGLGFAAVRDFAAYANTRRMRSCPRRGSTARAFPRMDDFYAIFFIRDSTRTKKAGSRWMACSPTLPERAEAVSTSVSRSRLVTRSPHRRYFSPPTFFPSPINQRPIR